MFPQEVAMTDDNARLAEDERLAEEVYDRVIASKLKPEDDGKFVVIAFNVDDFEIDRHETTAVDRLRLRHPAERLWLMRTGKRAAHSFGGAGRGKR